MYFADQVIYDLDKKAPRKLNDRSGSTFCWDRKQLQGRNCPLVYAKGPNKGKLYHGTTTSKAKQLIKSKKIIPVRT